MIAREYGFETWSEWEDHVDSRSDDRRVLFRAAERAIRRRRTDQLKAVLERCPELAQMENEESSSEGTLLSQTLSYANFVGDGASFWTTAACAALLIEYGAEVPAPIYLRAMGTADSSMVELFWNRGVMPINLRTAAAAGSLEQIEALFTPDGELSGRARPSRRLYLGHDQAFYAWPDPESDELVIADAFRFACRCDRARVARFLLEKALAREPNLRDRIERDGGADAFLKFLLDNRGSLNVTGQYGIWEHAQIVRITQSLERQDKQAFAQVLTETPRFSSKDHVPLQNEILETAAFSRGAALARVLLEREAAINDAPPPNSKALVYAIDYGDRDMIDLLLPLFQPENDLPTWSGLGRLDRVKSFFTSEGRLIPGRALVYPSGEKEEEPRKILIHALGLACMNEQFAVADFLIQRGADINGAWGLHEPATVLHEVAGNGRLSSVEFLLKRGVDPTLRDDRFGATAFEWARYMGQVQVSSLLQPEVIQKDFFSAIQFGSLDDVRAHLDQGQSPNACLDRVELQHAAALFFAVRAGKLDVVMYLLEQGADATVRDSRYRGALHWIQKDDPAAVPIARALIAAGTDCNAATREGETPVKHALSTGNEALAALLREHGAKAS